MAEYDETNRGKIWMNKKKDPNSESYKDTLPDFTGELDVDGVKFFVDAWKRKPEANPAAPALNFKVKRKDTQPMSQRAPVRSDPISSGRMPQKQNILPDDDDMDGDKIPF